MSAHSKVETGRMTSKGQVLIPKAVRDAIGLMPNALYKVMINDQNQAVVTPIGDGAEDAAARLRRMREGLAKLSGIGSSGLPTAAIMRDLRGDWVP